LRLVRGSAPPVDELGFVIERNLDRNNVIAAAMALLVFLGIGWIFAVRGAARAPRFIRRVGRVVPWYLAAFALWGWWREVRILTSLYPIVLPLVLAYCYQPRSSDAWDC
jgi:RsiW-degrading membrane proteinase PrsW (M82 family)